MKTFKDLKQFEKRLEKGICWGDWIKVGGKVYKMVEYGAGKYFDYMLFQNKRTTNVIEIHYHCPSSQGGVVIKEYKFLAIDQCEYGYLYRY